MSGIASTYKRYCSNYTKAHSVSCRVFVLIFNWSLPVVLWIWNGKELKDNKWINNGFNCDANVPVGQLKEHWEESCNCWSINQLFYVAYYFDNQLIF